MKKILLFLCVPILMLGQTPIADILLNPTDTTTSTVQGSLSIISNQMDVNGSLIVKTLTPYTITNGVVNFTLQPNDTITNSGSYYTVNYSIKQNGNPKVTTNYSEKWVVTTSITPLTITQVRINTVSTPPSVILLASQITPGPGTTCLQSNGFMSVWATCSGNGGALPCIQIVTYSSTPNFDFSACTQKKIILTGNIIPSISNASYCQAMGGCTITFVQGSGPYTVTWPGSVLGGFQVGNVNGKRNVQVFTSVDGSNLYAITPGIINQ